MNKGLIGAGWACLAFRTGNSIYLHYIRIGERSVDTQGVHFEFKRLR